MEGKSQHYCCHGCTARHAHIFQTAALFPVRLYAVPHSLLSCCASTPRKPTNPTLPSTSEQSLEAGGTIRTGIYRVSDLSTSPSLAVLTKTTPTALTSETVSLCCTIIGTHR